MDPGGKNQKAYARSLRKSMTPAEIRLWQMLKGRQLEGRKFRRQHGIGPYVLDFYCPSEKLAVELDGESHAGPIAAAKDAERTAYLAERGVVVIRFENKLVFDWPEAVLERIREHFGAEPPPSDKQMTPP